MKKIFIYDLSLDNEKLLSNYLDTVLFNNTKEQCSKYHIMSDYLKSQIAWFLLQDNLLKYFNYDLCQQTIYINKFGKPFIDNIYFNISHSKNIVMIIIDNKYPCGIDVEYINKEMDIKRLAKRILLNNDNLDHNLFFETWTKIEAYNKLIGTGNQINKLDKIDYLEINKQIVTNVLYDKVGNKYFYAYNNENNNIDVKIINRLIDK